MSPKIAMLDYSNSKDRSTAPDVFLEKGVMKIYSKFTGEHPCQSVISNKAALQLN